ncbi:MAG: AI-2E family transporter [Pseudomonadota bacterium]
MSEQAPAHRDVARVFHISAVAALVIYTAHIAAAILIPLVVAGFLAFLIVTLKNKIADAPGIGRYLPNSVAFLAAFLTIIGGVLTLFNIIRPSVSELIAAGPEYQARFRGIIDTMGGALEQFNVVETFLREQGWLTEERDGEPLISQLLGSIRFGAIFSQLASGARELAANFLVILLYTAFFLIERGAFAKKIAAIAVAPDRKEAADAVLEHIFALIRGYLSIKTLTSMMTGLASYVVLQLVGVDFASFWAVLIFVLNFIPVIGSIVAVAFPVLLTAVQFADPGRFALVLVLLTAIQQAVGSFIEPRLMGASLNLSPLVILLSLTVWGQLWGIPGMLLCVPLMVIITITLSQFKSTRAIAILLSENGQIVDISNGGPGSAPTA